MRARITSSKVTGANEVTVKWNDGVEFKFAFDLKLAESGLYDPKRLAVSRTSAQVTVNTGTGC